VLFFVVVLLFLRKENGQFSTFKNDRWLAPLVRSATQRHVLFLVRFVSVVVVVVFIVGKRCGNAV
jgi:hypothetical protein